MGLMEEGILLAGRIREETNEYNLRWQRKADALLRVLGGHTRLLAIVKPQVPNVPSNSGSTDMSKPGTAELVPELDTGVNPVDHKVIWRLL